MESIRKAVGLSVLGVLLAGMAAAPFVVEHDRSQASAPIVDHDRSQASTPVVDHDRSQAWAPAFVEHDRTAVVIEHDRN